MTFFANTGDAWPDLSDVAREAGTLALSAAAHMYALIRDLEANARPSGDRAMMASKEFQESAYYFDRVAEQIPPEVLIEFGRPPYWRRLLFYSSIYVSYRYRDQTYRSAYKDLSRAMAELSRIVTDFLSYHPASVPVEVVFRAMEVWENSSMLARQLAIANSGRPYPSVG